MELIGKQIAIETILGQPPELHYPSWYAAQIEKLPPAPPEYLAEQAGILVTDSDTISRQQAIEALNSVVRDHYINDFDAIAYILDLPPAQPEPSQVAKDIARIVENEQDMRVIAQPRRSKGHWIEHDDGLTACECSVCHEKYNLYEEDVFGRNFCPNCGAEMEVTT